MRRSSWIARVGAASAALALIATLAGCRHPDTASSGSTTTAATGQAAPRSSGNFHTQSND